MTKSICFTLKGNSWTFKFVVEDSPVSFKDWMNSPCDDISSESMKNRIIKVMLSNIDQFNIKVEANSSLKSTEKFADKVELLQKYTGKITSKGIKTNKNFF